MSSPHSSFMRSAHTFLESAKRTNNEYDKRRYLDTVIHDLKCAMNSAIRDLSDAKNSARIDEDIGRITRTLMVRADTYRELGKLEKAASDFRSIVELKPEFDIVKHRAYKNLAEILLASGGLTESSKVLEQAIAEQESPELMGMLSRVYIMANEFENAERVIKRRKHIEEDKHNAYCDHAIVHLLRNKYGAAKSSLQKAIQIDEGNKEAYKVQAASLIKQKKYNEAAEELKSLVGTKFKGWIAGYLMKSYAYSEIGNDEAAKQAFSLAINYLEKRNESNPEKAGTIMMELLGIEKFLGKNNFGQYVLEKKYLTRKQFQHLEPLLTL
jgi:tetratricopeptide (TPR) repeat protein